MSGTLRLRGSTSGYSELQAPAVAADQTFVLPTAGGTLLTTDSPVPKLTLELGSASQPSLTFQGDTDTGLFSEGTNTLNLVTGGSSKVVLGAAAHTIYAGTGATVRAIDIDSSGRVGVGTSNPGAGIDVSSGAARAGRFIRTVTSPSSDTYALEIDSSAQTGNLGTSGALKVTVNSGTAAVIDGNGRLGIGTTSPDSLLDLEFANSRMRFEQESGSNRPVIRGTRTTDKANRAISIGGSDISFLIGSTSTAALTSANEKVRIDSSGRLGVGTSSPSQALHIIGSSANASAGTAYNAVRIVGNSYVSANTGGLTIGAYWNNADVNGRRAYIQSSQGLDAGSTARDLLLNPSGGNVGIGTTSPDALLDVENSSGAAEIQIKSLNSSDCTLAFGDSADTDVGRIRYAHSADAMLFFTAANERLRIDSSGNLLIKTGEIDLQGGNKTIKTSAGFLQVGTSGSHHTAFIIGGTERMRIDSSGNVSIGVSSAQKRLHVRDDSDDYPVLIQNRTNASSKAGIAFIASGSDFADGQYASIEAISGPVSTTSHSLGFRTTQSGGTPTERLRIGDDGRLYFSPNSTGFARALSGQGSAVFYANTSGTQAYKALEIGDSSAAGTSTGGIIVGKSKQSGRTPFVGIGTWDTDSDMDVYLGGGWGTAARAATGIRFFTSTYSSNVGSGTEWWKLDSSGKLFTVTAPPLFSDSIYIAGQHRRIRLGNTFTLFYVNAGSGTSTFDTGITINQGNAGATMLLFANGNSSNGTATYSAIYAIQFYYDGNNTPTKGLLSTSSSVLDDWITVGKSATNTLTLRPTINTNWSFSALFLQ